MNIVRWNTCSKYRVIHIWMWDINIEFHSRKKEIEIEEIRLEEDAGRLTHSNGQTRMDYTYVGMPSIRIKTSSAFELGEEAELFLNELRRLVQYLQLIPDVPVENVLRCNAYIALAKYHVDLFWFLLSIL